MTEQEYIGRAEALKGKLCRAAALMLGGESAAVARGYVQYIGQTQTVDGVAVSLEYAIVDPMQAVFFYSVDGGRVYTSVSVCDEPVQAAME